MEDDRSSPRGETGDEFLPIALHTLSLSLTQAPKNISIHLLI